MPHTFRCSPAPGRGRGNWRTVVAVDAQFEAVFLEYPQCCVVSVVVADGAARGFAELVAQLVGARTEDRPR
jgi:hypothetical protein